MKTNIILTIIGTIGLFLAISEPVNGWPIANVFGLIIMAIALGVYDINKEKSNETL